MKNTQNDNTEKFLEEALNKEASSVQEDTLDIALPLNEVERSLISWNTVDRAQEKGLVWNVIVFCIFAGLFFYAVISDATSMVIALAALVLVLGMNRLRKPREVEIALFEYGIRIGRTLLPYNTLEAFWITYRPYRTPVLTIRRKKHILPDIAIDLHNQDTLPVRDYLATQLPEWVDQEETTLDHLMHFFH